MQNRDPVTGQPITLGPHPGQVRRQQQQQQLFLPGGLAATTQFASSAGLAGGGRGYVGQQGMRRVPQNSGCMVMAMRSNTFPCELSEAQQQTQPAHLHAPPILHGSLEGAVSCPSRRELTTDPVIVLVVL
eukprot:1158074-Pelagomonas_calceolata.AAC.2